jgi:hypothetical protein
MKLPPKLRKNRPFPSLNRHRLESMMVEPSTYACLQAPSGRTTQRQFLSDCFKLMDALVSDMCLITRKIGVATKNGFLLRTWSFIANKLNMEIWRLKQCLKWCKSRGWIESTQPREAFIDKKGNTAYKGLASIKRITFKYLRDIGLFNEFTESCAIAREGIKLFAKKVKKAVRLVLTPITMLNKFKREMVKKSNSTPNEIFDLSDQSDIFTYSH